MELNMFDHFFLGSSFGLYSSSRLTVSLAVESEASAPANPIIITPRVEGSRGISLGGLMRRLQKGVGDEPRRWLKEATPTTHTHTHTQNTWGRHSDTFIVKNLQEIKYVD